MREKGNPVLGEYAKTLNLVTFHLQLMEQPKEIFSKNQNQEFMQTTLKDKTKNQINTLYPYRTKGGWAFDDPETGLHAEAFVAGTDEIIDQLVGENVNQFTAHISKDPFPSHTGVLERLDDTGERGWYRLNGTEMEGWLCPACLKYFEGYPDKIYFEIKII